jgi:nucleotide-binding universal stress UspA family protein
MFRTILVPLDGSSLSEQALPLASQIARRAGAGLRLACVVPPHNAHYPVPHPPWDERAALAEAAWRVRRAAPGCQVQTALLDGPVAQTLADHAAAVDTDLMVLTTHGRGAFSRFWLGSVTDELVRRTAVPLLILRPEDAGRTDLTADVPIHRVVVPLDGSALAEAVLRPAADLARLYGAAVELFTVIAPLPAVGPDGLVLTPPGADAALLDGLVRQAEQALEAAAERLRREGLTVTTRVVIHDRVAAAVLDEVRPGDVVALATHGRRAVARWFLGSVADKLIRGAAVPVLVVRPSGT